MANKEIGDLTAASALTGSETIHVVQSTNSRRTTTQAIADLGGGGGHRWDWLYADSANRSSDWTQLATWTHSANVTEVEFTSISGAYTDMLIVATNVEGGSGLLRLSVSSNNGTGYSTPRTFAGGVSVAATNAVGMLHGYAETKGGVQQLNHYERNGNYFSQDADHIKQDTTAIDAIKFDNNGSNITAGTITIYGI